MYKDCFFCGSKDELNCRLPFPADTLITYQQQQQQPSLNPKILQLAMDPQQTNHTSAKKNKSNPILPKWHNTATNTEHKQS